MQKDDFGRLHLYPDHHPPTYWKPSRGAKRIYIPGWIFMMKKSNSATDTLAKYHCQECNQEFPMVWECLGCGKYKCRDCIVTCEALANFIETMTELGAKEFPLLTPYGSKKTTKSTKKQVEDGIRI